MKNLNSNNTPTAEQLNNFFSTIGQSTHDKVQNTKCSPKEFLSKIPIKNSKSLFFRPITVDETRTYIRRMASKATQDIYEISSNLVKLVAEEIICPMTDIVNSILQQGVFPDKLKIAKVCPILKRGNPTDVDNYRPISILPTFSKIVEMAIAEQLISFLNKNNYMTDAQFGFRQNRSTMDAVRSLFNYIAEGFEEYFITSVQYCDLSKAFDCMTHSIFLDKVEHYGVRGVAHSLLSSYLSDRKQCVHHNNKISSTTSIRHGIPQGSILGPLFFIIYMNDLPANLNCHTVLYADDTTLAVRDRSMSPLQDETEIIISEAALWFQTNKLCLNKEKTKTLIFSSSRRDTFSGSATFLGITMDARLTWREQCMTLKHKLHGIVYAIRRIRHIVSPEAALMVYYGLFHSRMIYGLELWGGSCHVTEILISQKVAVRAIAGNDPRCHCRPLFVKYKILTVMAELAIKLATGVYKDKSLFSKRSDRIPYNIRTKEDLTLSRHRLDVTQRSNLALKLYNRLPLEWRNLSETKVRAKLRAHLVDVPIYSLEEFQINPG
ncbi:hypothetical protein WA026_021134 [Henosepilachna vigintioctopunctata]|uniref:Reverse transcriptase domain-containing protein n=2 Tax=Henosepilachna vigintioctopunctata TaxID=420089 RepID=A0AAW1UDC2_9CUCU